MYMLAYLTTILTLSYIVKGSSSDDSKESYGSKSDESVSSKTSSDSSSDEKGNGRDGKSAVGLKFVLKYKNNKKTRPERQRTTTPYISSGENPFDPGRYDDMKTIIVYTKEWYPGYTITPKKPRPTKPSHYFVHTKTRPGKFYSDENTWRTERSSALWGNPKPKHVHPSPWITERSSALWGNPKPKPTSRYTTWPTERTTSKNPRPTKPNFIADSADTDDWGKPRPTKPNFVADTDYKNILRIVEVNTNSILGKILRSQNFYHAHEYDESNSNQDLDLE